MTVGLWYAVGVALVAMLAGCDLGYTLVILRLEWGREGNPLYRIGKGWIILAANWGGLVALIWGFYAGPWERWGWALFLGAWLLGRAWVVRHNYQLIVKHATALQRAIRGGSHG